ncbi:DNA topoisomerase VI subunit B, partial [Candidatus Woesearchaeota archaeon]|nr:DNA topoisomerase VI subunit B [Candidatus Woesearchaeota archaeon]
KQSLTADEPVFIRQDGKAKLVKIGDLVDGQVKGEGAFECDGIEALSFDDSYNYSFRPVSHLIKHKRENEIIKIKTSYGKSIKVTGCHSIFGIDKETLKVREVQARELRRGDLIIAPKVAGLSDTQCISEINILEYIDVSVAKKQGWFLYTDQESIKKAFESAKIIHKKKAGDKSRKYYCLLSKEGDVVDVLDDSYKQYVAKGFIPLWIAKLLGISDGIIRTYFHGKEYSIPSNIQITSGLAKLLGLFVAEGHIDNRQVGFTFSRKERDLVRLVCEQAFLLGSSHTVEERPEKNCVRVKIFGGLLSHLFSTWCGKGAHNKRVPEFMFSCPSSIRQDFIDYLYIGDGHNTKGRNQLMLTTVSSGLANQVSYIWLLQGVVASISSKMNAGLGRIPGRAYVVTVYGNDINFSNYFSITNAYSSNRTRRAHMTAVVLAGKLGLSLTHEEANYLDMMSALEQGREYSYSEMSGLFATDKPGYKLRYLSDKGFLERTAQDSYCLTSQLVQKCQLYEQLKKLANSGFLFLSVKEMETITEGYDYVYDLSVPGTENFVAGLGGISAHNSRGQQGIGISASVMYSQLTTGRPAKVISKIAPDKPAHFMEVGIDTSKNEPVIYKDEENEWDKPHGTRIEMDMEGAYLKGGQSVDEYLKETAIVNPHVLITYVNPKAEQMIFPRATEELPKQPKEIKPHPYGVELGMLQKMMASTDSRTLQSFLTSDFSRVGAETAKEICEEARVLPNMKPKNVSRDDAEKIIQAIKKVKIISPPTDCISPLGEEMFEKGMKKEVNAEFYVAVTRKPSVYRGNPFVVEVGIAYGGNQRSDGAATVLRFANRVALLYQQGACGVTKSIVQTNWKSYGLQQSNGSLPVGALTIAVHIASVWVPFTSESKEAIAHYPEIISEIKLALQEAGRKLQTYVHKKHKVQNQLERANLFERYIPEVAYSLAKLTDGSKEAIERGLKDMINKSDIQAQIHQMEALKGEADETFNKKNGKTSEDDSESGAEEQEEAD